MKSPLQQYFESFQQYFEYNPQLSMPELQQPSVEQLSSTSQEPAQVPSTLSKFKPWVFKPKKTLYSLQEDLVPRQKFSTSHWNNQENEKYIAFLLKFREVIEGEKKMRRKWHLNRIMSKYVGTRSHEQCRSHHQKMIKNYGNIEKIIQRFHKDQPTNEPSQEEASTVDLKNVQEKIQEKVVKKQEEPNIFSVLNWQQNSFGLNFQHTHEFSHDFL